MKLYVFHFLPPLIVAPNARGKEIEQSFYDKAYYKYFNPAVTVIFTYFKQNMKNYFITKRCEWMVLLHKGATHPSAYSCTFIV